MLKVYILEDELNIARYLWSILENIPYVTPLGHSVEIEKGRHDIEQMMPDVILADIQLKDGLSLELLSNLKIDVSIIFITAYDQYAIEALNLGAIGYLVKPIEPQQLTEVIEKCYRKSSDFKINQTQLQIAGEHIRHPSKVRRIALKTFEFTQIVDVDDILYCFSDRGYTTFFLKDDVSLMVSKVIKHYEAMLPDTQFIRCHQSYLINSQYIHKYYKDGQIEMKDGKMIPVSSRKRETILQFIDGLC
ncbi:response regulator [Pedobacter sp. BAL39]|uniref:LytR/AlgR family response regulator transcription factor n=1 Tax=Pedobacter sp. BAL39 TaxID=391596 RepID=UPI0001559482|nr:LytTR family DNA-binding domain-containing protein [Pedobacter sp. BAL39]EDM34796.1 response regulator [Pedobacter sp. BAL39]